MRKRKSVLRQLACIPTLAFILAGCSSTSQTDQANSAKDNKDNQGLVGKLLESTKPITIPAGTPISVVLDQAVSSAANRSGDTFEATVSQAVVIDGKTVIPKDARAKGRVVEAKSSGRLHSPARLELALTSVQVDAKWYDVDTNDTTRVGRNHNKHNLIFIGGGTAAGALIGGLVGGGKGALIGSAVGAGGGTAAAAATGKAEIRLPAETRLTFRLAQPLTIPVKS